MIVVLMGYMGSGKSTIGKALATVLNYDFIDLDDYITNKEKSTIPELFNKKGEIYFRKKETYYLNELFSSKDNIVLALGGGTPCYGNNMSLIKSKDNVTSCYLKLSIPNLSQRLIKEKNKRPLISHLNSEEDLLEFIGKHLFERAQYYNQAQYIINTDDKSEKDIIEDVLTQLI